MHRNIKLHGTPTSVSQIERVLFGLENDRPNIGISISKWPVRCVTVLWGAIVTGIA